MRYFTSDLHYGHRNVIPYCNRPYKDLDEMHRALIAAWNSVVQEGDEVYVIGDFSLNKRYVAEILPQLKGIKILVSGNHDKCFNFGPKTNTKDAIEGAKRRYAKACEQYVQDGFQSVNQELKLVLSDGTNVLLAHLPYAPKDQEKFDRRYLELRPKWEGLPLLHGHLHGRYIKHGNMIDVGHDAHGRPISEAEVISIMKDDRVHIDSPITEFYNNRKDDRGDAG